ncbi:MAG: hypothetical protein ABII23_03935 [bacterium]
MNTWEDILYDAKKSFYQKSRISPEHIKLKKALEVVEKEIKPISQELKEKKQEIENLKAFASDAAMQLRLVEYEKDKQIEHIKQEAAQSISERLKEKDLFYASQIKEYDQRIEDLKESLRNAQNISEKIHAQKNGADLTLSTNMHEIFNKERAENLLILKRKDEEIMMMQGRLIRKEDEMKNLSDQIKETEDLRLNAQKQWLAEISFSRDLLKKTIEEMNILQNDHIQHESELINDFQQQIIQYAKHVSYLEKEFPKQRFSILQAEIQEKQTLLDTQENEIGKLKTALEEAQKLVIFKREAEQLQERNKTLEDQIRSAESLYKTAQEKAANIQKEYAQIEQTFNTFKAESINAGSKSLTAQEDFKMLQKTCASLRTEKQQLELTFTKEKELLQEKLTQHDSTITDLKNTIHQMEEQTQQAQLSGDELHIPRVPTHFNFIPNLPEPHAVLEEKNTALDESEHTLKKSRKMDVLLRVGIRISIIAACLAALFIGKNYYGKFSSSVIHKTIDPSFASPEHNPSALIWDGLTFWSADWFSKKIFKHRSQHISEIGRTIALKGIIPASITWAEGSMWVCDTWAQKIYRLKLDNGHIIESVYGYPGNTPSGLAWDGTYMWTCDADSQRIYRHKIDADLRVITAYASPGSSPSGLLWDGDTLWSCDRDTGKIYRHRTDRNLSVIASYQPRDFADNADTLIGITWDGKYFWTLGEKSGRFYRHSLSDMIKSR